MERPWELLSATGPDEPVIGLGLAWQVDNSRTICDLHNLGLFLHHERELLLHLDARPFTKLYCCLPCSCLLKGLQSPQSSSQVIRIGFPACWPSCFSLTKTSSGLSARQALVVQRALQAWNWESYSSGWADPGWMQKLAASFSSCLLASLA